MDEMKIRGPFFEKILTSIIKKFIYKKFQIKPASIAINDLDISLSKTTVGRASIEIKLDEAGTDVLKNKLSEVI